MIKILPAMIAASALSALSAVAFAQELSLEQAQQLQKGCLDFAAEHNHKMAVAIYDVHGNLKQFSRMDGASVAVANIARWKAKSAATYQFPTSSTKEWGIPEAPDIATSGGGIPVRNKAGDVIGAIGVSGAPEDVDIQCAKKGIAAAGFQRPAKLH